jgi:Mn2+/Fe2+ NRAMP family transporter
MSFMTYLAESITISPDEIGLKNPVTNGRTIWDNSLDTAYLWAGIVCIIIIVIAGYFYVTSNGNAATIKRAKDAIMGAVIGLILIIFAFTITQFIIGRF